MSIRNFSCSLFTCILLSFFLRRDYHAACFPVFSSPYSLCRLQAFILVSVFVALSIIIFVASYSNMGYTNWDSTYLHTDLVLPRYLVLGLVVPFVIQFVSNRVLNYFFIVYEQAPTSPESCTAKMRRWYHNFARLLLLTRSLRKGWIRPEALPFLTLTKIYTMFGLIIVNLILSIVQSYYDYWIPGIFPVYYISPTSWTIRFRVLAVQLMMIPFTFGCLIDILGAPSLDPNVSRHDHLLVLSLFKERSLIVRSYRHNMHRLRVTDVELELLFDKDLSSIESPQQAVADPRSEEEALSTEYAASKGEANHREMHFETFGSMACCRPCGGC